MFWVRIDNRLIHGQVIETWIPFTNAKRLVVANDELAKDVLQQEIVVLSRTYVRRDELCQCG